MIPEKLSRLSPRLKCKQVPITDLHLPKHPWRKKWTHISRSRQSTSQVQANCHHFIYIIFLCSFSWWRESENPSLSQSNTQAEVSLTKSCDCKNKSHEVFQSSCASLVLRDSAEELRVLPFPPKKYTPDMSWNRNKLINSVINKLTPNRLF